ncbi:hypothetical protein ACLB2K_061323 [Fragaria x ananassa]
MERNFIWMWKKEPDVVFENLKRTRVMVKLDDRDWDTAITAIGDVLKVIKEDAKRSVLLSIAHAVQQELFKSKEIDVETIRKVAAFYPRCVEVDDDKYDDDYITAYADFKLTPDAEEVVDEADGADDDDDDDDDEGEGEGEDEDEWTLLADEEDDEFLRFLNTDPMEFEEAGINELKKQCNIMGCSLKQGQERQIISFIVSFFTGKNFKIYDESRMEKCSLKISCQRSKVIFPVLAYSTTQLLCSRPTEVWRRILGLMLMLFINR